MFTTTMPPVIVPAPRRSVAGNVVRGFVGNLIEWYDWYAYTAFSVYCHRARRRRSRGRGPDWGANDRGPDRSPRDDAGQFAVAMLTGLAESLHGQAACSAGVHGSCGSAEADGPRPPASLKPFRLLFGELGEGFADHEFR